MKNKKQKTEEIKTLTFICPKCKGNRLEVIETNAIVSSVIANLDKDGDFDYENLNVDDFFKTKYCIDKVINWNTVNPIIKELIKKQKEQKKLS